MKKKLHILVYTFLGIALAVAVFAALDAELRARRSAQTLEDDYTQRLMEAQEHLQAIAIKLNKAPVAGAARTRLELLTGVSRQADGVAADLSALPLSHQAMSDTVKFCNQLSEYALSLALLTASGQSLGEETRDMLRTLEQQCVLLLGQFATARGDMLSQSLRLAASDAVFYSEAQDAARPLERVGNQETGMDYPTMIYDGAFSDARHAGTPKALGMERVDEAQAVDIARRFVGEARVQSAVPGVSAGGPLESWGVTLTLTDGVVLNAEVTRQGGQMLWIMPERASFTPTLTLEECERAALDFLRERGFGELQANHYQVYDGLAVLNLVPVQEGVPLYPDLVKAQIRMDTGELVGLEANNYLMNHTRRDSLTPALSKEEALAGVSEALSVRAIRLCVIPYREDERLCWEIGGLYNDDEYRVYVDAQTGAELEVLMMLQNPEGKMAA